jgi:FkbM family methyltransferase
MTSTNFTDYCVLMLEAFRRNMTTSRIHLDISNKIINSKGIFQEENSPNDLTLLCRDSRSKDTLLSRFTLPNGLEVYQQGATQTNIIYAEVFEAQIYLQYGITLPAQACIFDVGAHIGLFSLFAHQRQSDIRIFAFEPGSTSYQALYNNLSLHSVRATPLNYGLSSTSTAMPLVFFPYMSGMSGLFANLQRDKEAFKVGIRHWMQSDEHEPMLMYDLDKLVDTFFAQSSRQICQLKTLSEAMRENNVEHINLLKIDVEGNELQVLKGIQEQDWSKIEQIVAEVHSTSLLEQIVRYLVERGYNITIEVEEGEILERFEEEGGYRLYMLYARQGKQATYGEIRTVYKHRYHKSPQELADLLQLDSEQQQM